MTVAEKVQKILDRDYNLDDGSNFYMLNNDYHNEVIEDLIQAVNADDDTWEKIHDEMDKVITEIGKRLVGEIKEALADVIKKYVKP